VAAVFAVVAACGNDHDGSPDDAALDAAVSPTSSVVCPRAGTSSVTGTGPSGPLDTHHVYARAVTGFCSDELVLLITNDEPLTYPYRDDSLELRASLHGGELGGTATWSGTFPATLAFTGQLPIASGTLQVDQGTSVSEHPTQLRATALFNDGGWRFTATIDAPYCEAVICL